MQAKFVFSNESGIVLTYKRHFDTYGGSGGKWGSLSALISQETLKHLYHRCEVKTDHLVIKFPSADEVDSVVSYKDYITENLFTPDTLVYSDNAYRVYVKPIEKMAVPYWERVAENLTFESYGCGCLHDCCGCFVKQICRVVQVEGKFSLNLQISFNY